jgi:hypothetical protein
MTLEEMLEAVDELPWDDVEKIQARIDRRRKSQRQAPVSEEELRRQIDEILKDAEPVELVPGTMNVKRLEAVVEAMRAGLTQEELNELADAIDEEYIKPDDDLNG